MLLKAIRKRILKLGKISDLVKLFLLVLPNLLIIYIFLNSLTQDKKQQQQRPAARLVSRAGPDECDEAGRLNEWLSLDKKYFFKRTGGFYLADMKKIKLLMVQRMAVPVKRGYEDITRSSDSFKLVVEVKPVENEPLVLSREVSYTTLTPFYRPYGQIYGQSSLEANFDLTSLVKNFTEAELPDLVIEVFVINKHFRSRIKRPIRLKMRHSRNKNFYFHHDPTNPTPIRAMLCSKCLTAQSLSSAENFRWWAELNKRAGFSKLVVCNHSVPYSSEMNAVLKDLEVEVKQLRCIPNLLVNDLNTDEPVRYFMSFEELVFDGQKHEPHNANVFHNLITNECFLDHIDEFDYVSVQSTDELLLPQVSDRLHSLSKIKDAITNMDVIDATWANSFTYLFREDTCSRWYAEAGPDRMTPFLKHIVNSNSIESSMSIYFSKGHVFNLDSLDTMFTVLDDYLQTRVNYSGYDYKHMIPVADPHVRTADGAPHKYELGIQNHEELIYSLNLVKLYKKVRPIMKLIHEFTPGATFDRFFTLLQTKVMPGNTLFSTTSVIEHQLDKPSRSIVSLRNLSAWPAQHLPKKTINTGFYFIQDEQQSYVLNFRHAPRYPPTMIFMRYIYFDFNYFNCYFLPTFSKIYQKEVAF